jgi:hypothetical protein
MVVEAVEARQTEATTYIGDSTSLVNDRCEVTINVMECHALMYVMNAYIVSRVPSLFISYYVCVPCLRKLSMFLSLWKNPSASQ